MGFRNVNELKVATVRELVSPQFIFGGGGSVGCPRFFLKSTVLPDAPNYGYWTYVGYNSSNPAGPFNETPATNVFKPGTNNQIGQVPNPSISLENVTAGYYQVRYRHGKFDSNGQWLGNEADWEDEFVVVYLHPDNNCAGGDASFSTTASGTVDLNTYLPSAECPVVAGSGTWTDDDGVGAAFNPGTGILDLSGLSTGSYSFTYSILPSGFTEAQPISTCANQSCLPQSATVTVNLDSGLVVTIANASETATVTQVFRDPDTLQAGYVKAYVQNNVEAVTVHGQTYISDDKGIDAFVEDDIFRSVYHYTKMVTGNRIKSGGHFTYLDVVKKDLTPIRIPLANDNAEGYQATLTGPYGTVNSADLLFDPFSIYDWIAAMEKVIKNYLSTQGYTQGTHYNLNRITVNQETATEYAVEIWFRSRHNPTGEWLGIEEGAASVAELDPENTMSYVNNHDMAHGLDLNPIEFESYNSTELGCVAAADLLTHYRVVNEALVIDTFACNHFTLVLQGSSIPATAVSISNTKQCTSTKLTASASPCSGTLTYSWDNGDSDAITYGWPGDGTLTVTANCDNPVDSDNETYTL